MADINAEHQRFGDFIAREGANGNKIDSDTEAKVQAKVKTETNEEGKAVTSKKRKASSQTRKARPAKISGKRKHGKL